MNSLKIYIYYRVICILILDRIWQDLLYLIIRKSFRNFCRIGFFITMWYEYCYTFPNNNNYNSDRSCDRLLHHGYRFLRIKCLDPLRFLSFIIIFILYFKKSLNSSIDVTFDRIVTNDKNFFIMIWPLVNVLFYHFLSWMSWKTNIFAFFLYANFS